MFASLKLSRRSAVAAGLGLALTTVAGSAAFAETMRLKIAGTHALDHSNTVLLNQIKSELESADVGLKVSLFPANQLGSGEQVFGDVQKGVIDIAHTFVYSTNDPRLEISTIPYLVEDYDQMRKVFAPGSNFYRTFSGLLAEQDVKLLGIVGEGFIGVGASKKPDNAKGVGDKGMTIRVWSANVAKETSTDIGFNTTTIDWGDVFPALQQGVVDGVIGGTPEANYTAWRDALKYYIPYNAFVESTAYYMSNKVWNELNDKQQMVVQAAFSKAALSSFDVSEEKDTEFTKKLSDAGIEVIELSDAERTAIANHVRATTWPKMEKALGKEMMDALKADIQ